MGVLFADNDLTTLIVYSTVEKKSISKALTRIFDYLMHIYPPLKRPWPCEVVHSQRYCSTHTCNYKCSAKVIFHNVTTD